MSLVSVITPCYNCEKFISHVIDIVQNQTLQVDEHILVDDGSTDGTYEKMKIAALKFSNVYIFSQENLGAGSARNRGIAEASGKYIIFLDSDDSWSEQKLEVQISFMEENDVLFSFGDYIERSADNSGYSKMHIVKDSLSYSELLSGCPIGCLTVAYNQKLLGKRYMPIVKRGQDWALWLNITKGGVVGFKYPGIYAFYNVQSSSLSKNKFRKIFDIFYIYRFCEGFGVIRSIYFLLRHILYRVFYK